MTDKRRFRRLARTLHVLSVSALVLIPVGILSWLLSEGVTAETVATRLPQFIAEEPLTTERLGLLIAVSLLPVLPALYTLEIMRQLFARYAGGDVISIQIARLIQRIGLGMFILVAAQVVIHPIQGLLITWANSQGNRMLSIALSESDIGLLLAAGLVTLIGWAMAEAHRIAEENRSFV